MGCFLHVMPKTAPVVDVNEVPGRDPRHHQTVATHDARSPARARVRNTGVVDTSARRPPNLRQNIASPPHLCTSPLGDKRREVMTLQAAGLPEAYPRALSSAAASLCPEGRA